MITKRRLALFSENFVTGIILESILSKRGIAKPMIKRVVDLAELSPKEAFFLIYKKVKRKEMYEIIHLMEKLKQYKLYGYGT